jgi:hypothetical protein
VLLNGCGLPHPAAEAFPFSQMARAVYTAFQMFTPIRLELIKLLRARSFQLSFAALTGFIALMLRGFYSYVDSKTGGQATEQFKYAYESKSYFNGLTFALYSVVFRSICCCRFLRR